MDTTDLYGTLKTPVDTVGLFYFYLIESLLLSSPSVYPKISSNLSVFLIRSISHHKKKQIIKSAFSTRYVLFLNGFLNGLFAGLAVPSSEDAQPVWRMDSNLLVRAFLQYGSVIQACLPY